MAINSANRRKQKLYKFVYASKKIQQRSQPDNIAPLCKYFCIIDFERISHGRNEEYYTLESI